MAQQPNDPAEWLSIFRQQLDDVFHHIFDMRAEGGGYFEFLPQLDIYETTDFYVMEIDLPGFAESDIAVSMSGRSIRIEGVKKQEKVEGCISYYCLERHFGRFCRILEIPLLFDPDRFSKKYERGVLTVSFPRIKGAMDGN